MTPELIHRLHFAFTITFHYLFPQLTMGLGLLIVVLKTVALRSGSDEWDGAARFWGRIFGINFVFGVVTGIPMEFEFGTNWARFSQLSGGVIGQPLAMEGVFSFFLEADSANDRANGGTYDWQLRGGRKGRPVTGSKGQPWPRRTVPSSAGWRSCGPSGRAPPCSATANWPSARSCRRPP